MMRYVNSKSKKVILIIAVLFAVTLVSYIRTASIVPGEVTLIEGEEYIYDFKSLLPINIRTDREGLLKLGNNEIKTNGSYVSFSNPVKLRTQKKGKLNLKLKVFGVIPLKTIHVDIVPNKKIIACGNTVGVKLKIEGILVLGVSNVDTIDGKSVLPTKEINIRPGDLITDINGKKLNNIDDLVKEIEKCEGNNLKIRFKHGDLFNEAEIKPAKSADDKRYHIGLWVRDSSAGIGTLTFYDPETKAFGALGHGITDIDTGTLMPVENGDILESRILAIKKGRAGNPGELKGVFIEDRNKLGMIKSNCSCGIYGVLNSSALSRMPDKQYPIATKAQVKEGSATILANIDGEKIEEFTIEIQKVLRQNSNSSKGMLIRITDQKLLDATGGIVQGMSGSPILQNDRIVGAVTHVLVNDPTRGYGIFIEGMLKNINMVSLIEHSKAS